MLLRYIQDNKMILNAVVMALIISDSAYFFLDLIWGNFYGGPTSLSLILLSLFSIFTVLLFKVNIRNIAFLYVDKLALIIFGAAFIVFIYRDTLQFNYVISFLIVLYVFILLDKNISCGTEEIIKLYIYIISVILCMSLVVFLFYRYVYENLYLCIDLWLNNEGGPICETGAIISWESSVLSKYALYVDVLILFSVRLFGIRDKKTFFILMMSFGSLYYWRLDGPFVVGIMILLAYSINIHYLTTIKKPFILLSVLLFVFVMAHFSTFMFHNVIVPLLDVFREAGIAEGLAVRAHQNYLAMQSFLDTSVVNYISGIGVERTMSVEYYDNGAIHSGLFLLISAYGLVGYFVILMILYLITINNKVTNFNISVLFIVSSYMYLNGLMLSIVAYLVFLCYKDGYVSYNDVRRIY